MFEKKNRLRIRRLLEESFRDYCYNRENIEEALTTVADEPKMTRKTRSKIFQPGYCEICHIPYKCGLDDHVQSSRHLKLTGVTNGDNGDFLPFIDVDAFNPCAETNGRSARMSRTTRNATTTCHKSKEKETDLSPNKGQRLRSRKHINYNYMTPPQEEDSLSEKPEREVRTSTRLLAVRNKQLDHEEVWHSGRPKRACNRPRISADERLVVDNKSYYKVDVLPTKLRSGTAPFTIEAAQKASETKLIPDVKTEDKHSNINKRKMRNSELARLNDEAENFLFPKKDESSDDDDEDATEEDESQRDTNSLHSETEEDSKKITEDEESMHSTGSESKGKRKRRTHAEAFILDNQKYYKFETPGSRLRYQGSYLSPVPMLKKNNGDCISKKQVKEEETSTEPAENTTDAFSLSLDSYKFSFENVPKNEAWYETFNRHDRGEEKYIFLDDEFFWNPLILPYQLNYIPPLNPQECLAQYNQIRKCLLESTASTTSTSCSTPDPQASNSSAEPQDEDSKLSTSVDSTKDTKPVPKKRGRKPLAQRNLLESTPSKNPRKSPRQHASTLAILSSFIQKRKRASGNLSTIREEPSPVKTAPKKPRVDYIALAQQIDEELTAGIGETSDVEIDNDDELHFHWQMTVEDMINIQDTHEEAEEAKEMPRARRGRKPGKRKKNRTGWPMIKAKRMRLLKEANNSVDSNVTSATPLKKKKLSARVVPKTRHNVNNNRKRHHSIVEAVVHNNCDSSEDRVKGVNSKVLNNNSAKARVEVSMQLQPYVRVQKLDRSSNNHQHVKNKTRQQSKSPKRTNRPQRRMPASPKSPRILRKPRGRWYRER